MKRRRIGVLFGGPSAEHEISRASAQTVFAALDQKLFQPAAIYITKKGEWHSGPVARQALNGDRLVIGPKRRQLTAKIFSKLDCAIPVFHGAWGEDGTIQALLEAFRVPYAGSGIIASALGMDKARSRILFRAAGLRVPSSVLIQKQTPAAIQLAAKKLGYPVVVKPNRAGSSFGVQLVREPKALRQAIRRAKRYDTEVLLEQYCVGRELTVSVIGSKKPQALPITEIQTKREFFDLHAKYQGAATGETQEICPALISATQRRQAWQAALTAHQTLGCRGLTRTDMILSPGGTLTVLEINTSPGLTENSLAPRAIRAAGYSLTQILTRLIHEAHHS